MAFSKKIQFEWDEIALSEFAKIMSHPARVAILKVLAERDACVCGEIVKVVPLAQSTVSQHLKELKAVGLIDGTLEGAKCCYCINWEAFDKVGTMLTRFFDKKRLQSGKSCC